MPLLDVRADHLALVKKILAEHVPHADVWAFGSRAKWLARDTSDLDLCVDAKAPLTFTQLGLLKEAFEDSDLPYKVDVVDWATTSESFRKIIGRDRVVVQRGSLGWSMNAEAPTTDLIEFNPSRPIKKGMHTPFIDMAAILENSRDVASIVTREYTGGGAKFKNGDTVFARITPCLENGKTAKIAGLKSNEVAHGSTEFIVLAAKEPEFDEDYVYYLARHPEFRAFAIARMEGASGRQRVSWQALADFKFPFPGKEYRKQAGAALRSIDDKINLNRSINQTLEAMAQTIFKSWFVDFEPVKAKIAAKQEGRDLLRAAMSAISGKSDAELDTLPSEQFDPLAATAALFPDEMEESALGEIPRGWCVQPMPDSIEINPTRPLRKGAMAPYLGMANVPTNSSRAQTVVLREFASGSKFINGDTLLARITPYLENGKTAFVDFLGDQQVGWGATAFIVLRPKGYLPIEFAYFLCRHPEFRAFAIAQMAGTSGRQRVPNDGFSNYLLTVPSKGVATEFGALAKNFMSQIRSQDESSKTLATLRDTLLPKLLSGELSVTNIHSELEAMA
jgi:type I restriction enzyme, S subunit